MSGTITSKDIIKIIETASTCNVQEIKIENIEIKFDTSFAPNNRLDTGRMDAEQSMTVVEATEGLNTVFNEEEKHDFTQEEIEEEMLILSDPVKYEQLQMEALDNNGN